MEAGYDYLLVRRQFSNAVLRYSGYFCMAVGAILLIASIGYLGYTRWARAELSGLNFAVQPVTKGVAVVAPASLTQVGVQPLTITTPAVQPISTGLGELAKARESSALNQAGTAGSQQLSLQIPATAIAQQSLYPGEILRASTWSNPLAYEPSSYVETLLLGQFKPVDLASIPGRGTLAAPIRIIIPSIDVDSQVDGLQIMNLGDSRAYETPKNTVGHIPQSFNAGEKGSAWFFGHLESPIMNEGAVFYNLPKIPSLLRNGEEVHVIIESGDSAYLYKITEAIVVNQDELQLDYQALKELKPQYANLEPGSANIHLVACVPRWDYSRRLVVSGTLVGVQ